MALGHCLPRSVGGSCPGGWGLLRFWLRFACACACADSPTLQSAPTFGTGDVHMCRQLLTVACSRCFPTPAAWVRWGVLGLLRMARLLDVVGAAISLVCYLRLGGNAVTLKVHAHGDSLPPPPFQGESFLMVAPVIVACVSFAFLRRTLRTRKIKALLVPTLVLTAVGMTALGVIAGALGL